MGDGWSSDRRRSRTKSARPGRTPDAVPSGIVQSVESGMAALIGLVDSVAAYLEPGEEIVVVEGGQAADFWKGRRGIQDEQTPDGVSFVKHQMGVVITTRRFLMFKLGGLLRAGADELLVNLPVAEIDSIVCVGHSFK